MAIILLLAWYGAKTAVPMMPSSLYCSTYGAMMWINGEQSLHNWAMSSVSSLLMNLQDMFKMRHCWRLCDTVQKELDKTSKYMRFGSYTSIEEVCEAIFTTHDVIYCTYYQCPNNHQQLHSQSCTIYLSRERSPFKSTAEWMQTNSQQGTNQCETCDKPVNINISFVVPSTCDFGVFWFGNCY